MLRRKVLSRGICSLRDYCSACPLFFGNTNAIDKAQLRHCFKLANATVWIRTACLSEARKKKSLQAMIHPPVNRTANSTADPPQDGAISRHKLNGLVAPGCAKKTGSCSKRAKDAPYSTSTDLVDAEKAGSKQSLLACACVRKVDRKCRRGILLVDKHCWVIYSETA